MQNFYYPDYRGNNILNITASLASFLNCPNGNPTVPELDSELNKGYKNVVFVVFDALGTHPLSVNSPKGYFSKHIVKEMTTVFPSTTACASATLLSGLYPSQHGRFGWCMYLAEMGGRVDILVGRKSEDHSVTYDMAKIREMFPLKPFYENAKTDYRITSLLPDIIFDGKENTRQCENTDQLFSDLYDICKKGGKNFVYAHCPEPDRQFHRYGVTDVHAQEKVAEIERRTEEFVRSFPDTLMIVTADHGQTDIAGYVPMYRDEKLMSMLDAPLSIEPKAVSLTPKKNMEDAFIAYFNQTYGEDFVLMAVKDLVAMGVFGPPDEKLRYLGKYLAVGTFTHKMALMHCMTDCFPGQHTSLTEEMLVPLILLTNKK